MARSVRRRMTMLFTVAAFAVAGAASTPASAASTKSIDRFEDSLAAAGFEARPATTPERQAMLARLPANKLSRRAAGDDMLYVYPDPKACNCIYVGDQAAYGELRKAQAAKRIADEQQMTAEDYADPAWSWGAWGPWGPRWGRFGFGGWRGW